MTMEFRPIPGFPDYEIADGGYVLSYKKQGGGRRIFPVRVGGGINDKGYPAVHLTGPDGEHTRTCHVLLMAAFVGPPPEGQEVRHLNGDPADCRLDNLAYGTRSENILDFFRHHPVTHCKRGHLFDEENTRITKKGGRAYRACRACARDHQRRYRRQRLSGAES
jgi:hypothetical protein